MSEKREFIFASSFGREVVEALLEKIKAGQAVTADERLYAVKQFMATSPRDWSATDDLWTLYKAVFFDSPADFREEI